MRTLEARAILPEDNKSDIRWGRVVLAAVLSELAVIALLSAIIAIHGSIIAPGQTAAQYQDFGQLAGYYLAAPAAAIATFLLALWAVRPLTSAFIRNGVLVGAIATLLTLGFIVAAKPEHRSMYILSYILRITAGYAAGVVAQKMKGTSDDHARQVR